MYDECAEDWKGMYNICMLDIHSVNAGLLIFTIWLLGNTYFNIGCVTGYQVIRVIRIFAITYPFEYRPANCV